MRPACFIWPLRQRPPRSIVAPSPSSRSSDMARKTRSRAARLGDDEQELRALRARCLAAAPRSPRASIACAIRSSPVAQPAPGVGVAADLLDQPVVAPAAADAALRAERVASGTRTPCACSSRARAPAAGRARSRSPAPSSSRRTSSKCSRSASESRSSIFGAASVTRDDLGRVPVERAHRVDLDPRALLGVEDVVAQQVVAQLARVLGARLGVADAGQVQPHAGQTEPRVEVREQVDQLGVDRGVVGADRLGADLAVLAVAAGLRRLVAEHRPRVPELHGLRKLVHAVLDVRAADRRGALRAQRQRAAAAVLERVHLLAHDVGRLADGAHEQLRVLEDRRLDLAEAGALEQPRLAPIRAGPPPLGSRS